MSASGFSSILKITEVDDFIAPSQECIIPALPVKSRLPAAAEETADRRGKVRIELDDGDLLQNPVAVPQKVQINLTDCLACSGCITSAESILISQQSPDEMVRKLEYSKNQKASKGIDSEFLAVVTLSIQPVLSLARRFKLEPQETAERLVGFFKSLGADKVTTTFVAEELSLLESAREFEEKVKLAESDSAVLPIVSGLCPGWVCYAEKLHPYALKNISRVKTPQQIMGSLLKLVYGPRLQKTPDQIYHVTLMPCFDRKLEASRLDFTVQDYACKEVDTVVTPVEIENLLESLGQTITDFEPAPLDNMVSCLNGDVDRHEILRTHQDSGSGGFAYHMYRHIATVKGIDQIPEWKQGRNPDIFEASLPVNGKNLKFGVATGFRNIQTLVQKLKLKNRLNVPHYVELMACPTGCLNGGAQARDAEQELASSREIALDLNQTYKRFQQEAKTGHAEIDSIYSVLGQADSQLFKTVIYTEFHAIEKPSLGIKW